MTDDRDKVLLHRSVITDDEAQLSGDVETPWVELTEQAAAPASPTDKVSCLLYVLAADHRLRCKLSTGTVLDLTLAGTGPLTLKGAIAAAADFPPVAGAVGGVENGWLYYVTADVIDNAGAPAHTNTGQHVLAGSAIAWVTALAGWLDVSEQVNAQYIAATPTAIGAGDVVAMVNVAGAAVVTLPAAAVGILGKKISVHDVRGDKAIGTVIAITPDGTDTIDGVNAAVPIDTAFGGYELICVQTGAGPATYGWTTVVGAELKTAIVDRDFAGATLGRLTRTGVGTYAVIQDNLAAAAPPAITDDSASGYGSGSIWFDTTAHRLYVCDSATVGAAIWIGELAKNNVAATAPAITDDNLLGYAIGSIWIDTVTAIRWQCQSAATGAAIWTPEVRNNFAAAVDPIVTDDTALGYAVGSVWINTTAVPRRIFECTNPGVGAAVWRQLNALNNIAAAVAPAITDDTHLGYDVNSIWLDTTHDNAYICLDASVGAAVWRSMGALDMFDNRQFAATSETLRIIRALAPGRIVACSAETGTVAAAAESMTFDVQIAGVTALAGLITIDDAVGANVPVAGVLVAAPTFAAGDVITVVRVYVPGGGPTPMLNTVLNLEVQYS